MRLDLLPPTQVGPVLLGMSLEDARTVLRELPGFVPPDPSMPPQPTYAHYDTGLSIGVDLRQGAVIAVELYRSTHDDVLVVYDDLDVFRSTAEQVIEVLGARTHLDIVEDGRSVVAPDLLLSFWRSVLPEDEDEEDDESDDGRYFDSVLVAAPGYYDSPSGRPSYLD